MSISHERIYSYIHNDKQREGDLNILTYDNGFELTEYIVIDKEIKNRGYFARLYCSEDRNLIKKWMDK